MIKKQGLHVENTEFSQVETYLNYYNSCRVLGFPIYSEQSSQAARFFRGLSDEPIIKPSSDIAQMAQTISFNL